MEHDVEIKMIADVSDLKKQVADITGDMKGLEKQIGKTGKATTFSAVSQGLQMVEKYGKQVIAVMKDLINTFAEASRESTTWDVMMEHSKFSQEEIDSLKAYSSELQNYTGISDEAISNTERLLLSATDLTKDGLIRATNACADLSKAMGTDITGSAQTLAIALASPAEGLTRLRRSGILFTDEEEALIRKLEESGDVLKAQEIMLSKIEERYGGIAKAIGDTPIGTLDKIKETWGDIKENLGESILNSIAPALNLLLNTLNAIKQWQMEQQEKKGSAYGGTNGQEIYNWAKGNLAVADPTTQWSPFGLLDERLERTWNETTDAFFKYFTLAEVQAVVDSLEGSTDDMDMVVKDRLERAIKTQYRWELRKTHEGVAEYYQAMVEATFENGLPTKETRKVLQDVLGSRGSDVKTLMAEFYREIGKELANPILLENLVGKTEDDLQINLREVEEITEEMEKAEEDYKTLLQAVEDYNNYAEYYQTKGDRALATYWANKAKAVQEQIDSLYKIIEESTAYDDADEQEQGDESRKHDRFTAWAEELGKLTGSEKINALINFREEIGKVLASLSGEDKDDAVRALEEINTSLTEMVDNVLGYALPVVASFGETIGETLAGGEDAWKGFGRTAINSIAQVIEACGQEAIAVATKDLIASKFLDATAWAGLAKGAGIVALAGTVRGLARFERGGIVGGTGITGDSRLIRANAGELILTRAQQNSIANQLQDSGRSTRINVSFNGTVLGDQESVSAWVYEGIERAKYNGVI